MRKHRQHRTSCSSIDCHSSSSITKDVRMMMCWSKAQTDDGKESVKLVAQLTLSRLFIKLEIVVYVLQFLCIVFLQNHEVLQWTADPSSTIHAVDHMFLVHLSYEQDVEHFELLGKSDEKRLVDMMSHYTPRSEHNNVQLRPDLFHAIWFLYRRMQRSQWPFATF